MNNIDWQTMITLISVIVSPIGILMATWMAHKLEQQKRQQQRAWDLEDQARQLRRHYVEQRLTPVREYLDELGQAYYTIDRLSLDIELIEESLLVLEGELRRRSELEGAPQEETPSEETERLLGETQRKLKQEELKEARKQLSKLTQTAPAILPRITDLELKQVLTQLLLHLGADWSTVLLTELSEAWS